MKEVIEKTHWETTMKSGQVKRPPTHPVVKFYCKQRIEYMKKFIDFKSIKTALDVGAGTGFSSFHFPPNMSIIDVDFATRLMRLNPIKNKVQASAFSLPFKPNSFDLVFGWDFLHHISNPTDVVKEMARVTKNYLVLIEPNRNNPVQFLYGLSKQSERGTLKFHTGKLLELQCEVGFELIKCDQIGWLFAGPTPTFLLPIYRRLPFVQLAGIGCIMICKKPKAHNYNN